jgi:hypothetical protein
MKPSIHLTDFLFWIEAYALRLSVLTTWLLHMRDHPRRAEQIAHNKAGVRNALAQIRAAWALPAAA